MKQPGTKVKFNNRNGVVVDWKKYPKFLVNRADFNFRTYSLVRASDGLHAVEDTKLTEIVEGKEIRKITEGRVVQRWDRATGNFLGQTFEAGDLSGYQDENGNVLDTEDESFNEPDDRAFDMVQDPPALFEDEEIEDDTEA